MNRRHVAAKTFLAAVVASLLSCSSIPAPQPAQGPTMAFLPGARVLLDAHNCYPYHGQWADRLQRALSTAPPVAIEQDLAWYTDPAGAPWSIVAHEEPFTGKEPILREYFFEKVRPIVEQALKEGDPGNWPLITLNLDFKSEEPEHLAAIWELLGEYKDWLTTAERLDDPSTLAPLDVKPLLVLTGESDAQEAVFHGAVPAGDRLRVFGAVHVRRARAGLTDEQTWEYDVSTPPEKLIPQGASNYRRWWNNSWFFVEKGGATQAGEWTPQDDERLRSLVDYAHSNHLWIRFYTLNGHDPSDTSHGWSPGYNFGSLEQVQKRWRAAAAAGVDFIATDQYEDLAAVLKESHAQKQ